VGLRQDQFNKYSKNKVDHAEDRITIFFDAWKYEYSDPAAGLFLTITEQLSSKTRSDHLKEVAKNVGSLVLDIFSRQYIGISTEEARAHFKKTVQETGNLSEKLEELVASASGDKNVIVFIDDLDRCRLDNVIKILDSLKIFLNMKNFVFLIAVDMSKIKLAWSVKYGGTENTLKEGLQYLEKIFQIETAIPVPNSREVKEYIHFLNPQMPTEFVDLISMTDMRNPRSIKKLLNLISLRASIKKEQANILEMAFLWTIFENLVGIDSASQMYNGAGPNALYRFLLLPNQVHFGSKENTDTDKAHAIRNMANNLLAANGFSDLALGNTLHSEKIALYLVKASKIIGKMKQEESNIVKALEEVTHFSKSTYT
jgi:hypothetical protein